MVIFSKSRLLKEIMKTFEGQDEDDKVEEQQYSEDEGDVRMTDLASSGQQTQNAEVWVCPSCTFRNENLNLLLCVVCGHKKPRDTRKPGDSGPKMSARKDQPESSDSEQDKSNEIGGADLDMSGKSRKRKGWNCVTCHGHNVKGRVCIYCNRPKNL